MDIARLIKILDGKADIAEQDAFAHWMASGENHRQEFQQVRQLWKIAQGPWPPVSDREALRKIQDRIQKKYLRRKRIQNIIVSAAVLTLLTCAWILWPVPNQIKSTGENLAFNHASLKDVANLLEKKFDTQIRIAKSELEVCSFTGSFSKTSSLTDIMNAISISLSMTISNTQNGYEWRGKGC